MSADDPMARLETEWTKVGEVGEISGRGENLMVDCWPGQDAAARKLEELYRFHRNDAGFLGLYLSSRIRRDGPRACSHAVL
jgi:hypothetical protein